MPTKPRRLNFGDTVALVSPASAPPDPKAVDHSIATLEKLGFKVLLARNARKRWGFLAGTDRERASDLMKMFSNPKVKAIFCVRGGYGTARLLPLLDFAVIRRNPKIFVGYSDITSLHCALLLKANLISFHGPMLNSELNKEDCPTFTRDSLLRTLLQPADPESILKGYDGKTVSVFRRGKAAGQLIGGNLSVLCTTLGTPYQPPFKNKILFLEDLDEPPYRFDRMLTHLLNAGLLQKVAGIAIGINQHCEDPKAKAAKEYRQSLDDVLRERLLPLEVPVVVGLPFGHVLHNATLPFGARAMLDADNGDLVIPSAVVA